MRTTTSAALAVAALLTLTILGGCGADRDGHNATSDMAATGHEGHNHGPEGHHPEPAGLSAESADWCVEHAVPESECTRCHPGLIAQFKETGDWCAGHGLPESHCRLCNPGLSFPQEPVMETVVVALTDFEVGVSLNFRPNAVACATDGALIQFASKTTASRVGITVQPILESTRESISEAPAEILFDETSKAVITTSVAALVTSWLVSPGDQVSQGEVIALLQSPAIAAFKSAVISAQAHYAVEETELSRHALLQERGLISNLEWERQSAATEQARAEYSSARNSLTAAGLSEGDIDELIKHGEISSQLSLRAPETGIIIERTAQLGDLLAAGSTFATIGNPEALWIEAQMTEQQMREVNIGDQLTFSSDGGAFNRVGGEIIWLSRFLDRHTRMGTVRARVLDPEIRLRAGEFGRARIVARSNQPVCLVPKEAVQWEGCCNVVFVREAPDRYRPRKVRLIEGNGPYYQVSQGVRAGEEVVVNGAFLMKTELKKSSIGAGCCGLEPVG